MRRIFRAPTRDASGPASSRIALAASGRMKAIAEITDKRVARKMLAHVGLPSDAPEQWPARGPPELVGSFGGLDDEQRVPDDDEASPAADVE